MDYSRQENHGMGLTPALPLAYNNNNSNSSHAAPIIRASPCPLIPSTSPIARSGPIRNGSAHEEPDNAPSATFKYRECLRNHAAATGGHVLDGCCEFMPSACDPLKCAACNCHRNFHRRQRDHQYYGPSIPLLQLPPPPPHPARPARGSGSGATTESSGEERMGGGRLQQQQIASKKRFRTKFTAEQKGKMVEFAERVGWRMQCQEEAAVEDFCKQIGVRRHVLKVWMHNNKQHFIKKQQQQQQQHLPQPQDQQSNNGLPIN